MFKMKKDDKYQKVFRSDCITLYQEKLFKSLILAAVAKKEFFGFMKGVRMSKNNPVSGSTKVFKVHICFENISVSMKSS